MEMQKDEALRLYQTAQAELARDNLHSATAFAKHAHRLYPRVDGLPQLLSLLHVLTLHKQKHNGAELNWYAILQVPPEADISAIRKQYRRLALLHPDKNKSVGADAAFKLVLEAWEILSDRDKKARFDNHRKRNSSATKNASTYVARPASSSPQMPKRSRKFWKTCPICKIHCDCWCRLPCDCLRRRGCQPVRCPGCGKAFVARKVRLGLGVVALLITVKVLKLLLH